MSDVIPKGLPSISIPPLDWHATMALLPAAFVIALISFMEAMSSAKVIAIKTRQPWDENKELIGQGLAKIAAAFSHSMPVSGSFSRSALNLASDAQTGLSSVISAIFVLLTLLFFTPLLYHLPKPVLAAIIMMAVIGLINFRAIVNAWRASRDDGIASMVTFLSTLAFAPNIQNGILTGIILSLALLLYRMMRPHIAAWECTRTEHCATPSGTSFRHCTPGWARFVSTARCGSSMSSYFENALLKLERENPAVRYILVKCSGMNYLDASGVEMLNQFDQSLQE